MGRTVRVHLPERTVEGVLTHVSPELLILRAAKLPQPVGTEDITLDGEVVIERARIQFGQIS